MINNGFMINQKVVCIRAAVLCFFAVGVIGWLSGLDPAVCCKRAAAAMLIGYTAAAAGVKFLNFILSFSPVKANHQEEE
jgi:hypothetical protein